MSGLVFASGIPLQSAEPIRFTILVFSKTTGFARSIPDGIAAIRTLGVEHGFAVDATEDAATFTDGALARYKAVVFLSTTGDVLDPQQKVAFERYIWSGGGFVIRLASDTDTTGLGTADWSAPISPATLRSSEQRCILRTRAILPARAYPQSGTHRRMVQFGTNPRGNVHVLATVDEATYSGGRMGPIIRSRGAMQWRVAAVGIRLWATPKNPTPNRFFGCICWVELKAPRASLAAAPNLRPCGRNSSHARRLDFRNCSPKPRPL